MFYYSNTSLHIFSVVEAEYGAEDSKNLQEFHADHPFHFFLVIDELVVFQGRVVKP